MNWLTQKWWDLGYRRFYWRRRRSLHLPNFNQWFFRTFFQASLDRRGRVTPSDVYPWQLQERRELYLGDRAWK